MECPDCRQECMKRRDVLKVLGGGAGLMMGAGLLTGSASRAAETSDRLPEAQQYGPAGRYSPRIKVAFVRREEYGMWWPGAVYPGDEARKKYVSRLEKEAGNMGVDLQLRTEPIHNGEQANRWMEKVENEGPDGHLLVLQDRHGPAWDAARSAVKLDVPTVIFCPIGASFTTNTRHFTDQTGAVLYSAPEFDQAIYGMKMLAAAARMKKTRCLVLQGNKTHERTLADTGIGLRHLPESSYVNAFKDTATSSSIRSLAKKYRQQARDLANTDQKDLLEGVRAYAAAHRVMEENEGDAITMDCLGMGRENSGVPLPCLGWSRLNDTGVPAICEADEGAIVAHIMTHYLFDRPGFQQDPVADTDNDSVIGAHCSCATRLKGYDEPPEPFNLSHHHALRDITTQTMWQKGQPVTSLEVYPGDPTTLEIATGRVIGQLSVPPHGGCVVSVNVKFDGVDQVRDFPGFHQVWFYGDRGDELQEFAQLCGFNSETIG